MIPETIALLEGYAPLTSLVGVNIYDRPLKRLAPGITAVQDPMATPDAFSPGTPPLLRPSVVVSTLTPRNDHGGSMPRGWAAQWSITVACYAPPGGEGTLQALTVQVSRALDGQRVPTPTGDTGRIRATNLTVGPEDAPEFESSGIVVVDTYFVSSLWRAPR